MEEDISRESIADRLSERHAEIAAGNETNPAQLELDVVQARAHFMDAVIVMGNLRANEITNDKPALLPVIRLQAQQSMIDAAEAEQALTLAVKALAEVRDVPKLIVLEGGK